MTKYADPEAALIAYVARLERRRKGYQALYVRLSRLLPKDRTEPLLAAAEARLKPLAPSYDDALFRLWNNDLVLVCAGQDAAAVKAAGAEICTLVQEAGGGSAVSDEPLPAAELLTAWYDLAAEWAGFMALCRSMYRQRLGRADASNAAATETDAFSAARDAGPYARLEVGLRSIDIEPFLRHQAVCRLDDDGPPVPLCEDIYVAVDALRQKAMPNLDLPDDSWLAQQFAQSFDTRLLASVGSTSPRSGHLPVMLRLRITTVQTPAFRSFAQRLAEAHAAHLIVALHVADMFGNFGVFQDVRRSTADLGLRWCLDGVNAASLDALNLAAIGTDFYRCDWRVPAVDVDRIAATVATAGVDRFILDHCDSAEALAFGRAAGIVLYQGSAIDDAMLSGDIFQAGQLSMAERDPFPTRIGATG